MASVALGWPCKGVECHSSRSGGQLHPGCGARGGLQGELLALWVWGLCAFGFLTTHWCTRSVCACLTQNTNPAQNTQVSQEHSLQGSQLLPDAALSPGIRRLVCSYPASTQACSGWLAFNSASHPHPRVALPAHVGKAFFPFVWNGERLPFN